MGPSAPTDTSGARATPWSAVRDSPVVFVRAGRNALDDDVPTRASALAFNLFLSIPATLLLVVGLFSLLAEPGLIDRLMERLGTVVPAEAVTLVEDSLRQLERDPSAGLTMTIVGFVLALWTASGAVGTLMKAVNGAYDSVDSRGFVKRRLIAILLVGVLVFALLAVSALLVLGPHLQRWIGDAIGAQSATSWIWWTVQWPVLLFVLFGAFSVLYALATDHLNRRWRILSPGAAVAVVLWLGISVGFGAYASNFGSYNKTWGSLSIAIVTLVWLWLSSIALLYGAEVNAQAEKVARAGEEDELDVDDTVERTAASPLPRAG